LVRCGREVHVPPADGEERFRRLQRDDLVGFSGQRGDGVGWCNWNCEHDARRAALACDADGGASSPAGCEAVVDDDHRATCQRDSRAPTSQARRSPLHLGPLSSLDLGQLCVGHTRLAQHLGVQDTDPVLADRAHPQLGLERDAQFSHHQHVERCVERTRHLERHRHAAAREPEDEWPRAP
jgi:hypothetical protein